MLNAFAKEYLPNVPVFASGIPQCVILGCRPQFDRNAIADDDLFDPVLYPASAEDLLELDILDCVNEQLSEFEAEERLQDMHEQLAAKLQTLHHSRSHFQHPEYHKADPAGIKATSTAASALWSPAPSKMPAHAGRVTSKPGMLKCGTIKQCSRRS